MQTRAYLLVVLFILTTSPLFGQEPSEIPPEVRDSLFSGMASYVIGSTSAFSRYFGLDSETGRIDLAVARSPEAGDFALGQRSAGIAVGMAEVLRRLANADEAEQQLLETINGLYIASQRWRSDESRLVPDDELVARVTFLQIARSRAEIFRDR